MDDDRTLIGIQKAFDRVGPISKKKNASKYLIRGDVQDVLDNIIGKIVYRIGGVVSQANYIQVPPTASKSLGFRGEYLYAELRSLKEHTFVVHFDIQTTDDFIVRLSVGSIYKKLKTTDASSGCVIQVPLQGNDKWTVYAFHLPPIVATYTPKSSHYIHRCLKSVQVCSHCYIRNVFVSDCVYSPSSLPAAMMMPLTNGRTFEEMYEFSWVLTDPPVARISPVPSSATLVETKKAYSKNLRSRAATEKSTLRKSAPKAQSPHMALVRSVGFSGAASARSVVWSYDSTRIIFPSENVLVVARVTPSNASDAPRGPISTPSRDPKQRSHDSSPLMTSGHPPASPAGGGPQSPQLHSSKAELAVRTGEHRFLIGHTGTICSMAASYDSPLLASAQEVRQKSDTAGGVIRLWNIDTLELVMILQEHTTDIRSLDFSRSGQVLPQPDRRAEKENQNTSTTTTSSSSHTTGLLLCGVGVGNYGNCVIAVWDVAPVLRGEPAVCLSKTMSDWPITRCVFSPNDGEWSEPRLVSCGPGSIRFYRLRHNGMRVHPLQLNKRCEPCEATANFTDIAFEDLPYNPSDAKAGHVFVSTSFGTVYQVECSKRRLEVIHQLHSGPIHCMAINAGFCTTASDDNCVRVWPLDFAEHFLEAAHEGPVRSVAISPDGLKVAIGTAEGIVGVLDVPDHEYHTLLRSHTQRVHAVACSQARGEFATASLDGSVRVWRLLFASSEEGARRSPGCEQVLELSRTGEIAYCLAYRPLPQATAQLAPDAEAVPAEKEAYHELACGFGTGALRVFSVKNHAILYEFLQHRGDVLSLVYTESGHRLFSGAKDGSICVYDATNKYQPIRMMQTYSSGNVSLSIWTSKVSVADADVHCLHDTQIDGGEAVAFSPTPQTANHDGKEYETSGRSADSPPCSQQVATPKSHLPDHSSQAGFSITPQRTRPAFKPYLSPSPGGPWPPENTTNLLAAIGPEAKSVVIYDADTLEQVLAVHVSRPTVTRVVISRDGQHLFVTLKNGRLRCLSLPSGNCLFDVKAVTGALVDNDAVDKVTALLLSPEGRFVVTGGADGMIRMWDLATKEDTPACQKYIAHPNSVFGAAFLSVPSTPPRHPLDPMSPKSALPPPSPLHVQGELNGACEGELLVSVGDGVNVNIWQMRTGVNDDAKSAAEGKSGLLDEQANNTTKGGDFRGPPPPTKVRSETPTNVTVDSQTSPGSAPVSGPTEDQTDDDDGRPLRMRLPLMHRPTPAPRETYAPRPDQSVLKARRRMGCGPMAFDSVAWDVSGGVLAYPCGDKLIMEDLRSRAQQALQGTVGTINTLALDSQNALVASAGFEHPYMPQNPHLDGTGPGGIQVWDIARAELIVTLPLNDPYYHQGLSEGEPHWWVQSLAFSPDGRYLAACVGRGSDSMEQRLVVWECNGFTIAAQTHVPEPTTVIRWDPHNCQDFVGVGDNCVMFWLITENDLKCFDAHVPNLDQLSNRRVTTDPDENALAASEQDLAGKQVPERIVNTCLDFRETHYMLVGASCGMLSLYDTESNNCVAAWMLGLDGPGGDTYYPPTRSGKPTYSTPGNRDGSLVGAGGPGADSANPSPASPTAAKDVLAGDFDVLTCLSCCLSGAVVTGGGPKGSIRVWMLDIQDDSSTRDPPPQLRDPSSGVGGRRRSRDVRRGVQAACVTLSLMFELQLGACPVSATFLPARPEGVVATIDGRICYVDAEAGVHTDIAGGQASEIVGLAFHTALPAHAKGTEPSSAVVSAPGVCASGAHDHDDIFVSWDRAGALAFWGNDDQPSRIDSLSSRNCGCTCVAFPPIWSGRRHKRKGSAVLSEAGTELRIIQQSSATHTKSHPSHSRAHADSQGGVSGTTAKMSKRCRDYMAVGYTSGAIQFFNPTSFESSHTVKPHNSSITAIAYNYNATVLISGSASGTVVFTAMLTHESLILPLDEISGLSVQALRVSPLEYDLALVVAEGGYFGVLECDWSGGKVRLVREMLGEQVPEGQIPQRSSLSRLVEFSMVSPTVLLVTGGAQWPGPRLVYYDFVHGTELRSIALRTLPRSLTLSPSGYLIAIGTDDHLVRIIDYEDGTFQDFIGHSDQVTALQFSPSGKKLVSGGFGDLVVWDVLL
eukprot:Rmarinus@m.27611